MAALSLCLSSLPSWHINASIPTSRNYAIMGSFFFVFSIFRFPSSQRTRKRMIPSWDKLSAVSCQAPSMGAAGIPGTMGRRAPRSGIIGGAIPDLGQQKSRRINMY